MKKHLFYCLILLLGSGSLLAQKPNIVFIFADDLGYMDVGYNGNSLFETPHLDALAQSGMVFPNAYAGAGNCAPSRACLLSGQYTPRHGIYAVGSTTRGPQEKMKVVPVPNTANLDPGFVTMAEALRAEGYTTGLFGKWHLGYEEKYSPEAQGFDVYVDPRKKNPNQKRNEPDDPKSIFSLTDAACNFMLGQKDKPFFTFLSHHAIHSTLEGRPASIDRFRKKGLSEKMALYAACLYDLDESVGQVMDFLKKNGLDKNTLVVFTSDNGATQQSSQEPLRGSKGGYYEGGIREPFIVYFPSRIRAGSTNPTPIINLDLYPTFVSLAGGRPASSLDGENLLPLFWGEAKTTRRNKLFWHFPGYLDDPVIRGRDNDFRTRPVTVLRKGDWKLHLYHEEWVLHRGKEKYRGMELYNLKEDEGEHYNLAEKNTRKRNELLKDVVAWFNSTQARLPVPIDEAHRLSSEDGQ